MVSRTSAGGGESPPPHTLKFGVQNCFSTAQYSYIFSFLELVLVIQISQPQATMLTRMR